MVELIRYKMKDFLRKDLETVEEYSRVLKHLQPTQTKKRLDEMPLRFVDYVKKTLPSGTFEDIIDILAHLEGVEMEDILKWDVVEFYSTLKGVTAELERLLKMEEERLTPKHQNAKWEMVNGSGRMAPFGVYNTLDRLSDGDILKWDSILDMPYRVVMMKVFMDTVRVDIEHDMAQIKTNK